MSHVKAGDTLPRNLLIEEVQEAFFDNSTLPTKTFIDLAARIQGLGQNVTFADAFESGFGLTGGPDLVEGIFEANVPQNDPGTGGGGGGGGSTTPPPTGDDGEGFSMGALLPVALVGGLAWAFSGSKSKSKRKSKSSKRKPKGKWVKYKGKWYSKAQARAGFAGPRNQKKAGG